jgi:decaprenylphospho-beta-D-erythro-pentofuranosid-2-ulose 2-reductase
VTPEPEFPRRVAIFGATSDIAFAVCRIFAERGVRFVLVGRDLHTLEMAADDLRVRGAAQVNIREADFTKTSELQAVAHDAWDALGNLDLALVAFGTLPDQTASEEDNRLAEQALLINFVSPVLLCNALLRKFRAQGSGTIAVITSVAGDRGRQSNFLYGAAKGGLQRYLQGLRHRLFTKNVQVLDVRPGFVMTKMTAAMEQGGPLWTSADRVANDIVAAIEAKRAVLYTPWFWRLVMIGVRNIPAPFFHRTSL